MSKTEAAGDVPQVSADPAPAQTPTVTHYQQIAANLARAIDDMLALIPSFVESHPDTNAFVRTHQNVPLQFIATKRLCFRAPDMCIRAEATSLPVPVSPKIRTLACERAAFSMSTRSCRAA